MGCGGGDDGKGDDSDGDLRWSVDSDGRQGEKWVVKGRIDDDGKV